MVPFKYMLASLLVTFPIYASADVAVSPENTTKQEGVFQDLGKKLDKAADSLAVQLDESGTTAKIMGKYSIDHDLGPFKIQAYTKGGTVTLVGEVQSETQYEKAIMLAASTDDVHKVDASRLNVVQKQNPLPDVYLTALIKAKLIKTRIFEKEDPATWPVKVEAKSNIVYISGTLNSNGKKQLIIETIHSFDGIESIKDDVKVEEGK